MANLHWRYPVRPYKQLLSGVDIDHACRECEPPPYATCQSGHSLYVFTVTTTAVNQAAGSPYNILERYNPSCSLIMQPR
jgi:hypothetical protein